MAVSTSTASRLPEISVEEMGDHFISLAPGGKSLVTTGIWALTKTSHCNGMTVFLSGCFYAGKFAIQFKVWLNLDLAYLRDEPLFPASPRSPRISGQVFSKLASRCSPRSSTARMRCWASGHVSAAPNEVKASRSRSVGGNETWLTRFFAAARARRSKEAIRRG